MPVSGPGPLCVRMNGCLAGGGNSEGLPHSKDEHFGNVQVKELAHQQAAAFRLPATQLEKDGWKITLPCLGVLGQRDYLPPKDSQEVQDYQEVQCKEMVVLDMALQRCAIQSRTPPRVLCGAVQELCRCLTPLLQRGNLLDLKMLDVARKDSMTPAPKERASWPRPRVKEPIGVPAPNEPPTLEPKEAAKSEELALMQERRPSAPPGFTLSWADESDPYPLEDTALPVLIPMGAQLDLSSLETLQVLVSHNTIMRKVQYQYQSMGASMTSLQLDLPESSDHPNSSQWLEGQWETTPLLKPIDNLKMKWVPTPEMEYNLKWSRT